MSKFNPDGLTFYHGTSRIFLQSIKTYGLGGVNPNTDLKNLEVLGYLYAIVKNARISDPDLTSWEGAIQATIAQGDLTIRGQNYNFRHDGVYVAASHMRAAVYTCFNTYGSEVLEKCMILLDLLDKYGLHYRIPADIDLFKVEKYRQMKHEPVIIAITGLNDEDLETEDGKIAKDRLELFRHYLDGWTAKQRFEHSQYWNFKLLRPVPREQLTFYEVEFEGNPKTNNFEVYLTKL